MKLIGHRSAPGLGHDGERGSVSTWLVLSAFAMVLIVGLAVDLSGQVHAQQQVRDIAAQAARVGGQQLDATAVQGAYPSIAIGKARTAAQDYLAASGATGSVTVSGGTTVHVQVTSTYHPTFIGVVGIGGLTVSGEASARVIRTMGDTER
ncbi:MULTISPECIES: TadE/TadG family type IV pilus assembly protein [unclassified Isoptericola]|uniref:TadE/TadG family type IV pilus assembly protein n=1 Tax=unclassified Isoptericola TaxID=2623355 RepID=UPI00364FFAAE